jgi:inner membrane protein
MRGTTHLAIGLLVALLVLLVLPAFASVVQLPSINPVVFIPLVLLGALLPDVDHENSKINRVVPVTRIIPWFFSHRGFFHSLWPPFIILFMAFSAATSTITAVFPALGIYLVIGYISHLLSDMLTRAGIGPFHPLLRFRLKGPLRTGGIAELLLFMVIVVADALLIISFF